MATLLLTAVGTAIGGPVGGALGALAGLAVDGRWLKPGARQGPRLTELAVQTSSYGTQIAKLFGTIRVAGTVIWATDLIERRATEGGGKGALDTVRYSYHASFAVLLSARAIRGVGRIWADGKLLRGAGGDFKSRTGFRLHTGDADQAADPLIASAVGVGRATAMRGMAYAVFEEMALADYANRIPSLTFEVIADEGAVDIGGIVRELSEGAVVAEGPLDPPLIGFSGHGGSRRAVIETLAAACGGWVAPEGAGLRLRAGTGASVEVADAGVGGARGVRAIAPADRAPRVMSVGYYDPARDYQAGLQRAARPGAGVRERHEELPAVLSADTAKGVAAAMLMRGDAERTRRRVRPGWEAMAIAPGDRVRVERDATPWRVTGWSLEGMAVELELAPITTVTASLPAASGEVVGAPDHLHGRTVLVVAELPPLDDTLPMRPQLTVVAGGSAPGWRGATLMLSEDDGVSWRAAAALRAPGVVGSVTVPLGIGLAAIEDRANAIEVELAHGGMTLNGADAGAMDRGANLALVGNELIQFGVAEQLSARRWRLSRLWRGRRATEHAIGGHVAGERFALLDPASVTIVPVQAAIGATLRLAASGIGDGDALDPVEVTIDGASVAPPAPVHVTARGGRIDWVRRSRAGWRWEDGIDVPLAEERELYAVDTGAGAIEVATPAAVTDVAAGTQVSLWQIGTHATSRRRSIVMEN